jgi:hypothetical protein
MPCDGRKKLCGRLLHCAKIASIRDVYRSETMTIAPTVNQYQRERLSSLSSRSKAHPRITTTNKRTIFTPGSLAQVYDIHPDFAVEPRRRFRGYPNASTKSKTPSNRCWGPLRYLGESAVHYITPRQFCFVASCHSSGASVAPLLAHRSMSSPVPCTCLRPSLLQCLRAVVPRAWHVPTQRMRPSCAKAS